MKRRVAIAVLVAGCAGAGATPRIVYVTPAPTESAAAEPSVSTPAPVTNTTWNLGEAVPIISNANKLPGDVAEHRRRFG